jgi:hypothetical protein
MPSPALPRYAPYSTILAHNTCSAVTTDLCYLWAACTALRRAETRTTRSPTQSASSARTRAPTRPRQPAPSHPSWRPRSQPRRPHPRRRRPTGAASRRQPLRRPLQRYVCHCFLNTVYMSQSEESSRTILVRLLPSLCSAAAPGCWTPPTRPWRTCCPSPRRARSRSPTMAATTTTGIDHCSFCVLFSPAADF